MKKKSDDIHKLDPITLYSLHGIFPYKMIIHILIVIFTTIKVILLILVHKKILYIIYLFLKEMNYQKIKIYILYTR